MKVIFNSLLLALLTFFCIISCTNRQGRTVNQDYEKEILLKLINKRLEVAPLVAKSKWNTKRPIDDNAREKFILDNVESQAKKMGVSEKFARDFFRAQFEAGKQIQWQMHKKWQMQNHPVFKPSPDLATEVRPILDSLTPLLLEELKKIKPNSCNLQQIKELTDAARKIINPSFDDQIVETVLKPIKDYCTRNNKKHKRIPVL